jgi:HNH endonuclease
MVLLYEGHDEPRTDSNPNPKQIDQNDHTPGGTLTQNGHFVRAAEDYKNGIRPPERVRVYEKVKQGIWSYNGVFHLIDARSEHDGTRNVYRFKLVAVEGEEDLSLPPRAGAQRRRLIPTAVKIEVWDRDGGKCVICGSTDELHFDHDLPYSKGGTSVTAENVQLLCARHNLQKHDRII